MARFFYDKKPRDDLDLCGDLFARYSEECFTQTKKRFVCKRHVNLRRSLYLGNNILIWRENMLEYYSTDISVTRSELFSDNVAQGTEL